MIILNKLLNPNVVCFNISSSNYRALIHTYDVALLFYRSIIFHEWSVIEICCSLQIDQLLIDAGQYTIKYTNRMTVLGASEKYKDSALCKISI